MLPLRVSGFTSGRRTLREGRRDEGNGRVRVREWGELRESHADLELGEVNLMGREGRTGCWGVHGKRFGNQGV